MKITIMLAICLLGLVVNATDKIYNCTSVKSTFANYDTFKKKFMSSASDESPNDVTFVLGISKATVKGNGIQSDLKQVSKFTFIEPNRPDHAFVWTLVEGRDDVPTVLFLQKVYSLVGMPVQSSITYKCK